MTTPAKVEPATQPPVAQKSPAGSKAPTDTEGKFADAKQVFESNCQRCHSIGGGRGPGGGGTGGKGKGGGMRGPDLAKVGADPNHTRKWLMEHIRNAKAHKPESRMPTFEGKLQDKDIGALADYLGSLKGN